VLFVLSFLVLFIYNEFRTNNFIEKKVQQEHYLEGVSVGEGVGVVVGVGWVWV
jgi:hypothetical protein